MNFKPFQAKVHRVCLLTLLMTVPTYTLAQNARKITGTVIDENGEPLIGATITANR